MNYIRQQRLQHAASPLTKFLVGASFFGSIALIGFLLYRFGGLETAMIIVGGGFMLFVSCLLCFWAGELLLEVITGRDQF